MFPWGHVANQKHCIFTITMPTFRGLTRVVTYYEELRPICFHNPAMRWWCRVSWQIKCIIFPLAIRPMNTKLDYVMSYCRVEASTFKATWPLNTWQTWHHVAILKIYISIYIYYFMTIISIFAIHDRVW